MSFWTLLGDCFERTSKQKQPQDPKPMFKLQVAMVRESMARKIWILHELATLGPSGPTRNMALAVCVSVVFLLCGAPSPCYALLNTSECAHTPRVLSLPSAQACKHTHLGQVAGGERKHLNINILAGLSLDWEGGQQGVCVFLFRLILLWGRGKQINKIFQKVPGQSWEHYVYAFCYSWFVSASQLRLRWPRDRVFHCRVLLFLLILYLLTFLTTEVSQKCQQVVTTRPWIPNPLLCCAKQSPLFRHVLGIRFSKQTSALFQNMRFRRETRFLEENA